MWLKLLPYLVTLVPDLVRSGLQVWRDRAARKRAEAETEKLKTEGLQNARDNVVPSKDTETS
jgi:hypothetical protein